MSNYEERMSKKYNFFSNDKDVNDTSANEPEVSSETTSNMNTDEELSLIHISEPTRPY